MSDDENDPLLPNAQYRTSIYRGMKKSFQVWTKSVFNSLKRRTIRAFLNFLESTLIVAMVLLIVTFNIKFIVAILMGLSVGSFLFDGTIAGFVENASSD